MQERVLVERHGPIATVILNRPDKLNALDLATWTRLDEALRELDRDEELRCVVLRGAGDAAFSAGADISEFPEERYDAAAARRYGARMQAAMAALTECRHPILAAIRGVCVGGGLELAAVCDLRICGRSSRFGIPVSRLGVTMSHGELRGLLGLVGPAKALEILLEGRVFGAGEAKEMGLVNRVVADEAFDEEADATARRIADGAPLVHRWHKQFVRRLADPRPLSEVELDEGFACFDTRDFQIGYRAFLAKVKPEFGGR
jgi:enoyl-CoA hydratase/carnithine racemase